MSTQLSWLVPAYMLFLVLLVLTLFARFVPEYCRHHPRFLAAAALYLFAWLALALLLSAYDVFVPVAGKPFPMIALGVSMPLVAGLVLLRRSMTLNRALDAIPTHWLVGIQLYRSFGLIFVLLFLQQQLPAAFALPAGLGDLAIGLTAPLVAWWVWQGRKRGCLTLLGWNVLGIVDLVVALSVGFFSSPGRFQLLALDEPSTLITAFPLVLIPVFAVPLSLLLHVAGLKRLRRELMVCSPSGMCLRRSAA